jgi:flagellar protein FliO/FliZ
MFSIIFVFASTGKNIVDAKQLSVKDCIENSELCKEQKEKTTNNSEEKVTGDTSVTAWDYFKMLFALIFVIFLIYAFLKIIQTKNRAFSSNELMQNLGGSAFGNNRSVQLIKVGNRVLVLGVGEDINLLKEIDEESEVEGILEQYNDRMQNMFKPNSIIEKFINKKNNNTTNINNESVTKNFKDQFLHQLKEISNQRNNMLKELERDRKELDQ